MAKNRDRIFRILLIALLVIAAAFSFAYLALSWKTQILAGIIRTLLVLAVSFTAAKVIRDYEKTIRTLEDKSGLSEQGSSRALGRTMTLVKTIQESAGNISLSSRDNFATANDQAASMEEIESTINENALIAAEIADKTSSVATIALKMEDDVLNGFSVLEKNVKKMGDIKEKNSGVINGIISLGNKINKIRDIVRIINTITDQTKVIAFNAALEAASAGETGKRFAVVAAEVNRLADDIAGLTRQIREQVEEIQSSSSSLIIYSEEGSDRIAEGHKLIKDLEDIFKEIRSGAEITSNQAQTITVSTQKQRKSSEQINTAIVDLSRGLKRFINSTEEARGHAESLDALARELEQFIHNEELAGKTVKAEQEKHGD
jgi:methyl-accepting chemotaxis protein